MAAFSRHAFRSFYVIAMDLRPLIQPSFWFDLTPVTLSPFFERAFFVVFALFIISGAALRIMSKNSTTDKYDRQTLKKSARIATAFGIVGFVIYFFTFEEIQFFGARFWFLFWFVGLVIAILYLVRFVKKEVPLLRHRDQSRVEANKYLPRRS